MTFDPDEHWIDWHLTPRGWEPGDEKNGESKETSRPAPTDRVKTVRYFPTKDEIVGRFSEHSDVVKPLLDHYGEWMP